MTKLKSVKDTELPKKCKLNFEKVYLIVGVIYILIQTKENVF